MVKCEEKSIQVQAESSATTLSSSSSICKSVGAKPASSSSTTTTSPSLSSRKIKKFKGVRMRSWGSWVSEIRAPNQKTRIWLGSYSTAEAAARAYDAALLCLKGSSANLNFPNSSLSSFPHLHAAAAADNNSMSMSPKTIQRVAAAAAAATTTATAINSTSMNIPSPSSPSLLSLSPPQPLNLPSTSPSTSISISSSPSPSSSCSTHQDIDEVSLIQCWDTYTPSTITSGSAISHYNVQEAPMSIARPMNNDPWMDLLADLQSPKFVDQMLSSYPSFNSAPLSVEEYFYEESSDIRLWSFC